MRLKLSLQLIFLWSCLQEGCGAFLVKHVQQEPSFSWNKITVCFLEQPPLRALHSTPRRDILSSGALLFVGLGSEPLSSNAAVDDSLLADLPMIRLRLPQQGFGREYVAVQLTVKGKGPYDFMVDSGLTTEMITPHLQEVLQIKIGRKSIAALAAGGGTTSALVDLDGAALCCGSFGNDSELKLPKLHAVITDFPQEHIDPNHNVEGMLGSQQPILAFLDCGATFSCMNWKAAALFGLPPKMDPMYRKSPAVAALGIDGNMMTLPVVQQTLTFSGEVEQDPQTGRPVGFAPPPADWRPWDPIQMAIGDIPAFSTILGDGKTPYQGPAALIGLDVLSQRRVVMEAGHDESRRRRVFVSPSS